MVGDKLLTQMVDQIQEGTPLEEMFLRWNLRRTRYVAVLYLIMQALNVLDGGIFIDTGLMISFACTTVLNIAYLIFSHLAERSEGFDIKVMGEIYLMYWVMLPFACTFFFIYDMSGSALPANLLIIYMFLSSVPIFDSRKIRICFIVPYVWNIFLYIVHGVQLSYLLYGAMFAACGVVISLIAGRQYALLIDRLRKTSTYDQLTGLLTRHMGIPRAETLAAACKRDTRYLAAFMTDIDYFKRYNDAFGHMAGDDALQQIAHAVRSCFRRSSDVVLRFGGEEFLVVAVVENAADAKMLGEKINTAVRSLHIPAPDDTLDSMVTNSVGIYVAKPDLAKSNVTIVADWTRKADEALYRAKQEGRNRCVVIEG